MMIKAEQTNELHNHGVHIVVCVIYRKFDVIILQQNYHIIATTVAVPTP